MMRIFLTVLVAFVALLGIESCKKGDDTAITTLTTNVNFINATTDTLNYYVNGTRINNASALYPLGATGYLSTPFGEQNYQVKKDGNPTVLFSLPLLLDTAKIYSVFMTDNTAENTITTIDTLDKDNLSDTTSIRFVHTSPNLGDVDVRVGEGDTTVFRSRAFKSVSVFLPLNAGTKHIRIYKAGTDVVLSDEMRTLQVNRVYTLFTKAALMPVASTTSGTGLIINK
jgi:hypothetical protein